MPSNNKQITNNADDIVDAAIEYSAHLPDIDELLLNSAPSPYFDIEDDKDNDLHLPHDASLSFKPQLYGYYVDFIGLSAGIVLSFAALNFLHMHWLLAAMFVIILGVFLWHVMSIIKKVTSTYIFNDLGIDFISIFGNNFMAWRDVQGVKLHYYKTLRGSSKGWFDMVVIGPNGRITLDSTVKEFNMVLAMIAVVIRRNKIIINDITRANFAAMGHLFSHMDFTDEELQAYNNVSDDDKIYHIRRYYDEIHAHDDSMYNYNEASFNAEKQSHDRVPNYNLAKQNDDIAPVTSEPNVVDTLNKAKKSLKMNASNLRRINREKHPVNMHPNDSEPKEITH